MAQFLVNETYAVTAKDKEEAEVKAGTASPNKKRVIVVAESLRELPHPVHLLDAEVAFGNIGAGGKQYGEDRENDE